MKGYSKRNSSKYFLTTAFTGLMHYQKDIPHFYPNQPGFGEDQVIIQEAQANPMIRDLLSKGTKRNNSL